MAERSLSMREARGSIPRFSTFSIFAIYAIDKIDYVIILEPFAPRMRITQHEEEEAVSAGNTPPMPRAGGGVRRQASFASDDSGPTLSTASSRRRRDESIRKNAEKVTSGTSMAASMGSGGGPRNSTSRAGGRPAGVSRTPSNPSLRQQSTTATTTSRTGPLRRTPSTTSAAKALPASSAAAGRRAAAGPGATKAGQALPSPRVAPAAPGTVSSMNPDPAVALHANAKVFEAAAYMAAKRTDSVLVVGDQGQLMGILTDKDLAYRVVAENLDPKTTPVSEVMTANPVSVTTSSNATEALNKMVAGRFRHLPVVESDDESSDDGEPLKRGTAASAIKSDMPSGDSRSTTGTGSGGVVGVLDITRCLYEALEKLDRAYESSRRLNEALEGVEREWSIRSGSIGRYAEVLRDQLACPDLAGLLASQSSSPAVVGLRTTVLDATKEMRDSRETAVLVFDTDPQGQTGGLGSLAGIFTSKDLVLRVLAAGLDPAVTTVVRVMTPHPESVTGATPVVDALRKMHAGRYLHLPVVDELGVVEGMVDVLKLTYTTLNQMTTIQGEPGEGPVWKRFWDSTLNPVDMAGDENPETPGSSLSDHDYMPNDDSTVAPDDSASVFPSRYRPHPADHSHPTSHLSGSAAGSGTSPMLSALGEHLYIYKFKDSTTGRVHRFTHSFDSLESLKRIVASRISVPEDSASTLDLSYVDEDEDYVRLETDQDLQDAVLMARAGGWGRLTLSVDPQRYTRELEALNQLAGRVTGDEERVLRKKKEKETYMAPILMGSGLAVICAFLLGKSFR
ncbi:hypothetical protein HDU85_007162 [Gaertneriomyces sp. JEL0708]|nr:hypothetical protein HDU85_007162 [Gaertneriomyces sp. JEL0708]